MSQSFRGAVLVIVWLALWSDVSPANLLSGIVVAVVIVWLFESGHEGELVLRPVAAARFVVYFLYKLLESTIVVARTIIRPSGAVHNGIVAVPLSGCTPVIATLVANALGLMPGSLTLEVQTEPLTLFVHALDVRKVEHVQRDVRRLEVLAIRAFGSAEAIAGLEIDDTRVWRGR